MPRRRRNPTEEIREEHGYDEDTSSYWLMWMQKHYAWRLNRHQSGKVYYFDLLYGPMILDHGIPIWTQYNYTTWSARSVEVANGKEMQAFREALSDRGLRELGIANMLILEQMVRRMAELR